MPSAGILSNTAENKIIDAILRGQALGFPATFYIALIKGKGTTGKWAALGSGFVVGDIVQPTAYNGRLYKVTAVTTGITGASEPTWPTSNNGTVVDAGVTWTEMASDMDAGTFTEVSGGSYARASVAASLANFSGTQGAGTTVASTGTSGTSSNNAVISFPAPTADWGTVVGMVLMDAASAGTGYLWAAVNAVQQILNGQAAPTIPVGTLSWTLD
jgi:hypothetical protein